MKKKNSFKIMETVYSKCREPDIICKGYKRIHPLLMYIYVVSVRIHPRFTAKEIHCNPWSQQWGEPPSYHKVPRAPSSSIQLSATGRLLDITYMCYEFRTPLFPAQLLQARQSDLSVTSIPQSVNRWRHNEYSWCSHPLHFVQALHTPVVKVWLVVWRSDLTGQGARAPSLSSSDSEAIWGNKKSSTVI